MAIRRPGIPAIPPETDQHVRRVLMALKENVEIANGVRTGTSLAQDGWKQRSVTLGMLVKLGVVSENDAHSVAEEP